MKIIIVIPTYNEKDNLTNIIPEILKIDPQYEVLVVDDNSPDGTGEVAERFAAEYPNRVHVIHRAGKLGLGSAYREGFKFALQHGADYIFEMDADFSHDPKYLPEFIRMMDTYDVVIGSRYKSGISVVNWPLRRLILSWMATKYVRFVTGLKLTDCTTGYKCFSRKALEALPLEQIISNGYSFQIEVNYRLYKLGFKIGELPIVFVDRHSGTSKMSGHIIREALYVVWKLRCGI
ncbi:MAG: polyprenol monophosphomannose synthase [bacterium]|nr:polyprenol monophosphomannose synthase [bacterium]